MSTLDEKMKDRLLEALAAINDADEVGQVLGVMFTEREIDDAAVKLEIASRLKSGARASAITIRLQVSSKTVSKVAKELFKGDAYKLAFSRWEEWLLDPKRFD